MICIFYGLVSSILIFPNIIITSEKYEVYFDIFHRECQLYWRFTLNISFVSEKCEVYFDIFHRECQLYWRFTSNISFVSEKCEVYFDIFHSECQKIDILITSKVGNDSIESKIQLKINYLLKKSVKILLIKNK